MCIENVSMSAPAESILHRECIFFLERERAARVSIESVMMSAPAECISHRECI